MASILANPSLAFAGVTFTTFTKGISSSDQEVELATTLSLSGQANKIYYLEGAFKNPSSSSYFGLTQTDNGWTKYSASNYTSLKQISTDQSGNWTGNLKVKLDTQSSLYIGSGSYSLWVKRFTANGSSSWSDNSVTIILSIASPSSPTNTTSPTSPPIPTVATIASSATPPSHSAISVYLDNNRLIDNEVLIPVVTLSNYQPNSSYYLKGVFIRQGGSNYFGQTLVLGNWIKNNQSFNLQLPITTDSSGSWSGTVQTKSDSADSGFTGNDDYLFKVGLYSVSGSGPTWSNQQTVSIESNPSQEQAVNITSPPSESFPVTTLLKNTTPSKTKPKSASLSSGLILPRNLYASSSSVAGEAIFNQSYKGGLQNPVNAKILAGIGLIVIAISSLVYSLRKN